MTKKRTTANRLDPEVWDRIDRWRAKGWSYKNLAHKFKLSKSTLSYHYGKGQKEKTRARMQKRRDHFQLKVDHFWDKAMDTKRDKALTNKRPERTWDYKVRGFHKDKENSTKGYSFPWVACKITGRKVSVMVPKGHHYACNLDHILPAARGGPNNVENCQPLDERINAMKVDMTNEEFFDKVAEVTRGDMYKKYMKGKK